MSRPRNPGCLPSEILKRLVDERLPPRSESTTGHVELALVEWKYTESYLRRRPPAANADETRTRRYGELVASPGGPIDTKVPLGLMFDEPFYQLMRQQLLAHELESHHAEGADVVRVLHVWIPPNDAYQASIVEPAT